ncbi:MAG: hypothetical protein H6648_05555 [Caldilineae bacterium]|nr:hypothetical protein [Caldilineae bacterium]
MAVQDTLVAITEASTLYVLSATESTYSVSGSMQLSGSPYKATATLSYVLVSDQERGLQVVDVSNASRPRVVDRYLPTDDGETLSVSGVASVDTAVYLICRDFINVYLQSLELQPDGSLVELRRITISDGTDFQEIAVSDGLAAIGSGTGDLLWVDVAEPMNPERVASMRLSEVEPLAGGVSGLIQNLSGTIVICGDSRGRSGRGRAYRIQLGANSEPLVQASVDIQGWSPSAVAADNDFVVVVDSIYDVRVFHPRDLSPNAELTRELLLTRVSSILPQPQSILVTSRANGLVSVDDQKVGFGAAALLNPTLVVSVIASSDWLAGASSNRVYVWRGDRAITGATELELDQLGLPPDSTILDLEVVGSAQLLVLAASSNRRGGSESYLLGLDVSSISSPRVTEVVTYPRENSDYPTGLVVSNEVALVGNRNQGVRIVDWSVFDRPLLLKQELPYAGVSTMAAEKNTIAIGVGDRVFVIEALSSESIREVSSIKLTGEATGMAIDSGILFATYMGGTGVPEPVFSWLGKFDLSDPLNPQELRDGEFPWPLSGRANSVEVSSRGIVIGSQREGLFLLSESRGFTVYFPLALGRG